jgi:nucleoside phosphorylase
MRLLLVASDPMEFSGILAKTQYAKRELSALDWVRSVKLGGNDVLLAANGVGWNRAAAAVDDAAGFRPDAVVSTGFCGALDADLEVGDIVVGTSVVKWGRIPSCGGFPTRLSTEVRGCPEAVGNRPQLGKLPH